jgi:hypothetical protein
MKKIVFITLVLFALNSFSQNLIQNNINYSNQRFVQAQAMQVFASNANVNDNKINKPVRANTNPQVYVQRVSNSNVTQRRQRRRVTNNVNANISNPVQTNIINVSQNNINDDIQVLGNFVNQLDNSVGNAFRNENLIEQLASVNIPAIQLGSGSLDLNFNLPTLKFPAIKFSSRKTVSSSRHKTFHLKNKLAKLNRNMSGKLSFKKKLKIKVDNCFKW